VPDWGPVALRLAIYLDLALLFGVPLLALRQGNAPPRRLLLGLGAAGIALSLLGLLVLTASMAGTTLWAVDSDTLAMVTSETPVGKSFIVRCAALLLVVTAALLFGGRPRSLLCAAAAGVALASLAWAGHGAMDEGARGWVHLSADILHLLAAGAWIGAVAVLLWLVAGRPPLTTAATTAAGGIERALSDFAATGSVLVITIVLTGAVNGWILLGADGVATLGTTIYGRLLLVKLVLFVGMLAVAGLNRWALTPRLRAAGSTEDRVAALTSLRLSLTAEIILAIAILALVAWLGMLAPEAG
jgi:putative copper resistance protein D